MTEIQALLFAHRDPKYAVFIAKLIPNLPKESFIGVRSGEYGKIQKELPDAAALDAFMMALPHTYYEENTVHSVLLCGIHDFDECMEKTERFLPYVDNWAVCDGLNPPAFRKNPAALAEKIRAWMGSDAPYTRRFGMRMIMLHFLGERFDPSLLDLAADARSEEYYVNMMTAWLFAEALARQWDAAIGYMENRRLDRQTHNKAIQKAIESGKIPDERKAFLRTLKIGARRATEKRKESPS